jgi:hypothetical protein
MKSYLWRAIYAAIVVACVWWLVPLFLAAIGMGAVSGALWAFLKAASIVLAILYVLFGSEPPYPF